MLASEILDPPYMKVTLETLKNSEVKLTVELTAKQMEDYGHRAAEELQNQVKVDGFRPGKVPFELLKQKVGEQAFMSQVLDIAISDTYELAVTQNEVRPVAYPKITVKKHEPLEYEAIVAVLPAVSWSKDIKKLSVSKKTPKVEAKEIEEVLTNLKTRSTKWNDVERKAKKGDRVEVDFDGHDLEGNALPGTSSKNHPVVLGEGSLIPGFEDELIGMEKDQEKTFEITFPKDYHSEDFKAKKVKFTVTLRRIEEAEEPKMDDAFAAEITGGNRKTMDELKEEIKEELGKQKEKEEEARLENEFLKELATFVKADLPEVLIEREMELMQNRIKQDLEKRKQNWEDYLAELEKEGKDIKKELHKPATEQLLIRLGLEELYKEQPVDISTEELEAGIRDMIAFYPPHFAPMVEERYKEGSQDREMLKNQLRLRKLVAKHTK